MDFEFDPDKSLSNKRKHGIDFDEAQVLWSDPDAVEIPARTTDEPRFLVIGRNQRATLVRGGDDQERPNTSHLGEAVT